MNRKQVIETLEMENGLICFNSSTGEEIPLEFVNGLNRNCYVAHQEAIRLIKNSIPIEWLEKNAITQLDFGMGIRMLIQQFRKEQIDGKEGSD